MAGYCGYSKSNNAIDAENNGKFPASILARRIGVTTNAIRSLLTPVEYHHTSKMYNATDYYSEAEAFYCMDDLKAYKEPTGEEVVYENCRVEWLEWVGTRKRPTPIECHAEGVRVAYKGKSFLYLEGNLADRVPPKKKIDCTGLKIYNSSGNRLFFG